MACSKLEAIAIYVVKQECGNDILACVYVPQTKSDQRRKNDRIHKVHSIDRC
jgi:hypothetical protein